MMSNKPRIVRDYSKLDKTTKQQIKLFYPEGYEDFLIQFTNKDRNVVSALPFETEDCHMLIKMTVRQAQEFIDEDEDYDDDGQLKEEIKEEYEDNLEDTDFES